MAVSEIGLNYAGAFIEALESPDAIERAWHDLEALASTFKQLPALGRVLGHPGLELARRHQILDEVLEQIDPLPLTRRFVHLVLEKGRIAEIAPIAASFSSLRDARLNQSSGEVVTAVPIESRQKEQWERTLARLSGQSVRVEFRTDPSLLGGALARVGSVVYDGSLRKQLERIRGVLRGEP